ncbi:MAG: hypothetical protein AAF443_08555 [Chlamydiota bacterium]
MNNINTKSFIIVWLLVVFLALPSTYAVTHPIENSFIPKELLQKALEAVREESSLRKTLRKVRLSQDLDGKKEQLINTLQKQLDSAKKEREYYNDLFDERSRAATEFIDQYLTRVEQIQHNSLNEEYLEDLRCLQKFLEHITFKLIMFIVFILLILPLENPKALRNRPKTV